MRHLLFFSSLILFISCGQKTPITEYEPPLLGQEKASEEKTESNKTTFSPQAAVLMRPTYLMEKPGKWSETNKPTYRQKLPIGTQATIIDTASVGKRNYFHLKTEEHSGWSQNWKIYPNNLYSMAFDEILLFQKPDITAFTKTKIEPGSYLCLDTSAVGEFFKIRLLTPTKELKPFCIKTKDMDKLTNDTTDFKLYALYEQLQDSSNNQIDLLTQVEILEPSSSSPIYQLISSEFGNLNDLDSYLDSLYIDTLPLDNF